MAVRKGKHNYAQDLGPQIKRIRTAKGMKVLDVAKRTGLTSSTISQVERSKISPTLATLQKIALALDHPISHFFDSGAPEPLGEEMPSAISRRSPVVHKNQRKLLSPCAGITHQLLNPDMSGPIQAMYNVYEPGCTTGTDLYSHPGSECGLILEGELVVSFGDTEYHLAAGDSITFSSTEPHTQRNPGKKTCIAIWVNTPPWF